MGCFLAVVIVCLVANTQYLHANVMPKQDVGAHSSSSSERASGRVAALPPMPPGKTTVIGGAIRQLDPVRDQITLKVFGGRSMNLLFDPRTQVYRDGIKTPLRDLRPGDHASVETVLDGTNVFAVSIHVLSRPPKGECQGQVVSYNPGTRELTVSPVLSQVPIELRVPVATPVVRTGQAASSSGNSSLSDLVKGTLISVNFEPGNNGRGVATHIAILAIPGSTFVFTGNIAFLDLRAHTLVVADPRDGKSYKILFDPARFPVSHNLHQGAHVRVTTTFDGAHYVAHAIAID